MNCTRESRPGEAGSTCCFMEHDCSFLRCSPGNEWDVTLKILRELAQSHGEERTLRDHQLLLTHLSDLLLQIFATETDVIEGWALQNVDFHNHTATLMTPGPVHLTVSQDFVSILQQKLRDAGQWDRFSTLGQMEKHPVLHKIPDGYWRDMSNNDTGIVEVGNTQSQPSVEFVARQWLQLPNIVTVVTIKIYKSHVLVKAFTKSKSDEESTVYCCGEADIAESVAHAASPK
ncbi:hypothetical protein KEM54_003118, partial [Ascosphaera aggregata]